MLTFLLNKVIVFNHCTVAGFEVRVNRELKIDNAASSKTRCMPIYKVQEEAFWNLIVLITI